MDVGSSFTVSHQETGDSPRESRWPAHVLSGAFCWGTVLCWHLWTASADVSHMLCSLLPRETGDRDPGA